MINPFPNQDPALEAAIASALKDLASHQADSDEYAKAVDQLTKLYKIRNASLQAYSEAEKFKNEHSLELERFSIEEACNELPAWRRVSPETVLTVAGNLAIALIVVKYEQTGVISSQVRNFIRKF